MSDFFREIDEEVRRDQIAKLWQKYGTLVIVLLALVIAGIGGWRFYRDRQVQAAQVIGASFEDAAKLAKGGKDAEAEAAFSKIANENSGGYRMLARFRAASALAKNDAPAGVKAFDALAGDASLDPVLQDLARIRAATLLVDTAAYQEISARVEGLAMPGNAWRNSARELLGLSSLKAGDTDKAGRWFDQVIVDPKAAPSQRQRAELMLELVRSGPAPKS